MSDTAGKAANPREMFIDYILHWENRKDKYLHFHWDTFKIPRQPLYNLLKQFAQLFSYFFLYKQVIIMDIYSSLCRFVIGDYL